MLVSVVIPAYNREQYIEESVKSVLAQTYQDIEVLVVDDGSTDKTVEVAQSIADSRVKVIVSEKNGGACKARNIGIENAKGDYIAFQDSDDTWHKDKLEKSVAALEREGADFVFCALCREEQKGNKVIKDTIPVFDLNTVEDKFGRILIQNYVSTQTIVAKKEVFETVRFDERFPRFQDWDLTIQVLKQGFKVYFLKESLVDSVVLGDSISYNGKKALTALKLIEEKYSEDYRGRPASYYGFCQRAAYLVELSGYNGAAYFKKAYRSKKSVAIFLKYILCKLRLYWLLNVLVTKMGNKK